MKANKSPKILCGNCGKVPDRIGGSMFLQIDRLENSYYCKDCELAFSLVVTHVEIPNEIENPSLEEYSKRSFIRNDDDFLHTIDFRYNHLHKFGEVHRDEETGATFFIRKEKEK